MALQQILNALSLGGTYALLALGLAIVFSILNLINFAHGDLMTITGYVIAFTQGFGLPFGVAALLGVVAAMVSAVLMERVAFRPLRGANVAVFLLASFALSQILHVLFQTLISPRPKPVHVPDFFNGVVSIGNAQIGRIQAASIIATALSLALLTVFLRKTLVGIALRAAATDFPVTRLMGINANAVIGTAFALSGLLAGVAAILWVAQRGTVDPLMGFTPVLAAFVATVLGGLGSLTGAVAGGFLLGFLEIELDTYLPESLSDYKEAFTLAAVIAVLLVRPQGLLGRQRELALR